MDTPFEGWVEGVCSAMSAPPLTRRDLRTKFLSDPKWLIGDALLCVPEGEREAVAHSAGLDVTSAKSYARVSGAWPPLTRIEPCAWSTYRTLAPLPNRMHLIRPGMTLRTAIKAATGKDIDRKPTHRIIKKEGIDGLADEVVDLLLSDAGKDLVPKLIERLNASKEGRRRSMAKRSARIIRELSEEIRKVSDEIARRRNQNPAELQFMDKKSRFLKTRVAVEEIGLLYQDAADRQATSDDDWRSLAKRLQEHAERTNRIASAILEQVDLIDAEWVNEFEWAASGLAQADEDIAESEIVDDN
jgi:hypothetical protein